MSDEADLVIRRRPRRRDVLAVARPLAIVVVGVAFVVAAVVAALTQHLDGTGLVSALFVVGLGASLAVRQGRAAWAVRRRLSRAVVLRLADDGVTLGDRHLPWTHLATCVLVDLDASATGGEEPLELVRFVADDDRSLPDPPATAERVRLAAYASLTLRQSTALMLLRPHGTPGRLDRVAAWLAVHRPAMPVVRASSTPWVSWQTPDAWPDEKRVAVVGGSGRLGRRVLAALVERGEHPIALVRNELHRAALEALGAEVRMLDVDLQDEDTCGLALRHVDAVVHLAADADPDTHLRLAHEAMPRVARAAFRARARRFVWVSDTAVLPPAHAGSGGSGGTSRNQLDWTALRVRSLTDGPRGDVLVGPDVVAGDVARANLAEVLVSLLDDPSSFGRDLAVGTRTVDP